MTEQAKAPSGANAPYKIFKVGGKWVVKNNIGETKASFPGTDDGRKKALAYMAALYTNVPGAAKRADKVPFTGKAKQRVPKEKSAQVRRQAIAQKVTVPAGIERHNFLNDADNHCLTCKQIQDHPVHGIVDDPAVIKQLTQTQDVIMPHGERTAAELDPETAALKKHRYVGAHHLSAHVVSTAGWYGGCYACGTTQPHTGDVTQPLPAASPTPSPAVSDGAVPSTAPGAGAPSTTAALESVVDRVHVDTVPAELDVTRAFLTQVGDRTLLTAPASTFTTEWEKALTPNEHMLWLQGRFVGAEKANRNGAFWSTADLELGQPTVKHGPLNWLHEAKHIIGTIADAKLVLPPEGAAEGGFEPHIMAMAAVWKWIYPDEAFVVEEASDQNKLWYSMECISREVSCAGDTGCGKSFPYMDVVKASAGVCEHIKGRTSTRHFVDPTFLGGAVIVPPVRPGWAEADARVLREASALAETTYQQACPTDMTASEWERLMAQVVGYALR